jgi:hypothetical protein
MSNSNAQLTKSSNRSDDIDKEVNSLMRKNTDNSKSTYAILEELKKKYKDDEIVDSIMKTYKEKMKRVRKLAEKIKERLIAKYPKLSMKEYIEKIADYKAKYKFDDSEMQTIVNLIFLEKSSFSNPEAFDVNYNEMSKALGFVPASYNMREKLHVKQDEVEQLQMILTIASATKELHDQVTLQSLIYTDCDPASKTPDFDKNKINIFSYIHPVVAALFFPKFKLLDEHMLLASISNIIALKYNGQDLKTQPEYELYWDIATDPSETACVNKTKPFTDLVNRCNVQTKLWEAVLNLRQGKYYTNDLNSFIMAIDNCRASVFDAADLAYVKDEGTVMRKLLAAFSIRPTIVITMPVYGITPLTSHISAVSTSQVTTLSIIPMRIPMTLGSQATPGSISLKSALSQEQLYIHHRQLTVKQQQILYSRELLVFYVHRRYHSFNTSRLTNPYSISYLPITMGQYEKLQEVEIDVDPEFKVPEGGSGNQQTFQLTSVVCVETKDIAEDCKPPACTQKISNKIIVGCSTLIVHPNNRQQNNNQFVNTSNSSTTSYGFHYNPLNLTPTNNKVEVIKNFDKGDFMTTVRTKGTLFIYKTCDIINDISALL